MLAILLDCLISVRGIYLESDSKRLHDPRNVSRLELKRRFDRQSRHHNVMDRICKCKWPSIDSLMLRIAGETFRIDCGGESHHMTLLLALLMK